MRQFGEGSRRRQQSDDHLQHVARSYESTAKNQALERAWPQKRQRDEYTSGSGQQNAEHTHQKQCREPNLAAFSPSAQVERRLHSPQKSSTDASLKSDFDDRGLEVFLRELLKAFSVVDDETNRRASVIQDVQDSMQRRGLYVGVYGSARTGVLLPSSDLDFFVSDAPVPEVEELKHSSISFTSRAERHAASSSCMRQAVNALRGDRRFTQVIRIAHANVPIVKAVHRSTGIAIDFSFTHDGILTSELLNRHMAMEECRLARGLTILIKALLAQWNVNDPSVGGLGSFPVALMVLWFLQSEAVHYGDPLKHSFAVHLLGFLKYYGEDFDYKNYAIDFLRKQTIKKPISSELTIMNPMEPSRNAAKACSKFSIEVRKLFRDARNAFMRVAMEPADAMDPSSLQLILRYFHGAMQSSPRGAELIRRMSGAGDGRKVNLLAGCKKVYAKPQHAWNELRMYIGGNSLT